MKLYYNSEEGPDQESPEFDKDGLFVRMGVGETGGDRMLRNLKWGQNGDKIAYNIKRGYGFKP